MLLILIASARRSICFPYGPDNGFASCRWSAPWRHRAPRARGASSAPQPSTSICHATSIAPCSKVSATVLAFMEPPFLMPSGPPPERFGQILEIAVLVWNATLNRAHEENRSRPHRPKPRRSRRECGPSRQPRRCTPRQANRALTSPRVRAAAARFGREAGAFRPRSHRQDRRALA